MELTFFGHKTLVLGVCLFPKGTLVGTSQGIKSESFQLFADGWMDGWMDGGHSFKANNRTRQFYYLGLRNALKWPRRFPVLVLLVVRVVIYTWAPRVFPIVKAQAREVSLLSTHIPKLPQCDRTTSTLFPHRLSIPIVYTID